MLKMSCLSFMGGGGNSQKERGNNNFNIITQMLDYFLAQLVFSSFLCFDFPNAWEQGEN